MCASRSALLLIISQTPMVDCVSLDAVTQVTFSMETIELADVKSTVLRELGEITVPISVSVNVQLVLSQTTRQASVWPTVLR